MSKARGGTSEAKAEKEAKKAAQEARRAENAAKKAAQEALDHDEVVPWLRKMGVKLEEARFALTECGPMSGLTIETRLKRCLAVLAPPHRKVSPAAMH